MIGRIAQALALVLLVALATIGALEVDRRFASCSGFITVQGSPP